MVKNVITLLGSLSLFGSACLCATEYHVAISGSDTNAGSQAAPFRTIQHAADLAQPGDIITVHAGTYRERVNPPRGGESDSMRITYQAAPGEKVEIKGSEIIRNWTKDQGNVWKVKIPNFFFGDYNPFNDFIQGDWFYPRGAMDKKNGQLLYHTGAVYVKGEWLTEAKSLQEIYEPIGKSPLWFAAQMNGHATMIWAQFKDVDPNKQDVEINVRQTVFYPEKTGVNYITVSGFFMSHAATPWSPPTTEQIGLIGTNWSKGWIIENNTVSHSICVGIALGKYRDKWDTDGGRYVNETLKAEPDNWMAQTHKEPYVGTIDRALKHGWNKDSIGHHVVRNNTISHCEQAGIAGSLGAVFSTIQGNDIHDIHVRRLFSGAEMAGIKLHAAVDVEISHNYIHENCLGIWLDWMAQGARITGNLFDKNEDQDLKFEVNHGPILVDNNLFLSRVLIQDFASQGLAFVHNLIAGSIDLHHSDDKRFTPYFRPHTTTIIGTHNNPTGDDLFYNNLFIQHGNLSPYDATTLPVSMEGNVFFKDTKASRHEKTPLFRFEIDPAVKLAKQSRSVYLELPLDKTMLDGSPRKLVTTELLSKTAISSAAYENPDGSPLQIDRDYFGNPRNESNPSPGPFENTGAETWKVWQRLAP